MKIENFSLWCDFIERDFLEKEFPTMIKDGMVNGATSNPAIFKEAFLSSPAYKEDIKANSGKSAKEVYENLATKDIKKAAKILRGLYDKGDDGFISIEIDPLLCDDVSGSLEEAKMLLAKIDEPNVMIKVPATNAGFEVMQKLFESGVNVNATLIFSPDQAKKCLEAFERGLSRFKGKLKPKGVISVFVSRFDRALNETLAKKGLPINLLGIYNATYIYHLIQEKGIQEVRTLFASTGVKGDDLKKEHYINELLYQNSINTAPINAIEAFEKSNSLIQKEPISKKEIETFLSNLENADIDINSIYEGLLAEGLQAFKKAFKEILNELEKG
ncbi:MAG: transaldolase [Sulfurospirillum sp.]|nr:MAG: transaldolase [Sulfurospirillum sp.]